MEGIKFVYWIIILYILWSLFKDTSDNMTDMYNITVDTDLKGCSDFAGEYETYNDDELVGTLNITSDSSKCTFETNNIPNHSFGTNFDNKDANFVVPVDDAKTYNLVIYKRNQVFKLQKQCYERRMNALLVYVDYTRFKSADKGILF